MGAEQEGAVATERSRAERECKGVDVARRRCVGRLRR